MIPKSVPESAIQVNGTWDDFVIYWRPLEVPEIQGKSAGPLSYEVTILEHKNRASFVTEFPNVTVPWPVDPYSIIRIYIRGVTSWAVGSHTAVDLRTPADVPSEPTNLRVFRSTNRVCI